MLAQESHFFYTVEEYLAFEETAEYKSEYRQGEIIAMAGASLAHNRIVSNIHAALYSMLETKPCDVFTTDLRLWIARKNLAVYPDILVICDAPKFFEDRTDTVTNPKVIIEVLSESTASYDRSDKFHAYWTVETFEEYVLVDQYRVHVEYFRRVNEKQWEILVFTQSGDVLTFKSIKAAIPLERIYRNVTWSGG
jgi:Uma2 family endonuclease